MFFPEHIARSSLLIAKESCRRCFSLFVLLFVWTLCNTSDNWQMSLLNKSQQTKLFFLETTGNSFEDIEHNSFLFLPPNDLLSKLVDNFGACTGKYYCEPVPKRSIPRDIIPPELTQALSLLTFYKNLKTWLCHLAWNRD